MLEIIFLIFAGILEFITALGIIIVVIVAIVVYIIGSIIVFVCDAFLRVLKMLF